ncbi:kinase-like domain-containing protein [Irpex rosettiformis]|uniref:Kinase-like domain-containing protein n=1 Tax=Irpex rosettiformis TaxID=378272 RepID=A0ACB8TVA2_9APHY|nr:kinase-like domain-containing protein [Irpex rosettiformis]
MSKATPTGSSMRRNIPLSPLTIRTPKTNASSPAANAPTGPATSDDQFLTVGYDYGHDEQKTPLPSPRTPHASQAKNTIAFPTGPPSPSPVISFPAITEVKTPNNDRKSESNDPQELVVPSTNNIDGVKDKTPIQPTFAAAQLDTIPTLPIQRPPSPPLFESEYSILINAPGGCNNMEAFDGLRQDWLAYRAKYADYYEYLEELAREEYRARSRTTTSASESESSHRPSSSTSDSDELPLKERIAALAQARRKEPMEPKNTSRGAVTLCNDIRTETYSVTGMLGEGAYGRVMYAMSKEGEQVAIKVVHKAMIYRRFSGRRRVINELHALKHVTNADLSFVCPMLSAWDDDDNIYIVMPCLRENMLQRIEREPLTEDEVLLYSAEILHGVGNLHDVGIIHRDIKLENIVFDAHGHIALTDFGLSRITEENEELKDVRMYDVAGTTGYWAPEVVTVTAKHGYGWEADIWSMGMVFFEMATTRTTSFYHASTAAEIKRMMMLKDVPISEVKNSDLRDLLGLMLARDPKARWSVDWLREHKYYNDVSWMKVVTKDYEPPLPEYPKIDFRRTSAMRFSTFRSGKDKMIPNLKLTASGEIIHNRHALKSFLLDEEEPDTFGCSLNTEHRKALMSEFTRREGTIFRSRYAPTTDDTEDIPLEFIDLQRGR